MSFQNSSAKLIILRGNSGSGKSSVARRLREVSKKKIALVEQDYMRRVVLKEKVGDGEDHVLLIKRTVLFALEHRFHVILEGMLQAEWYGNMLKELIKKAPHHYIYYFDISFKETLRRHRTKSNAREFGEKEMKEWWIEKDFLDFAKERIIPEESSLLETVEKIQHEVGI